MPQAMKTSRQKPESLIVEPEARIELATFALRKHCSTAELLRHKIQQLFRVAYFIDLGTVFVNEKRIILAVKNLVGREILFFCRPYHDITHLILL